MVRRFLTGIVCIVLGLNLTACGLIKPKETEPETTTMAFGTMSADTYKKLNHIATTAAPTEPPTTTEEVVTKPAVSFYLENQESILPEQHIYREGDSHAITTPGHLVEVMLDNASTKSKLFKLTGVILMGNKHVTDEEAKAAVFDAGYPIKAISSKFYQNEQINMYIESSCEDYGLLKVVICPHRSLTDYFAMTPNEINLYAKEKGGVVIDGSYTSPDEEDENGDLIEGVESDTDNTEGDTAAKIGKSQSQTSHKKGTGTLSPDRSRNNFLTRFSIPKTSALGKYDVLFIYDDKVNYYTLIEIVEAPASAPAKNNKNNKNKKK